MSIAWGTSSTSEANLSDRGVNHHISFAHVLNHHQLPAAGLMVSPGGSGFIEAEHPIAQALNRVRNLGSFAEAARGKSVGDQLSEARAIIHGTHDAVTGRARA